MKPLLRWGNRGKEDGASLPREKGKCREALKDEEWTCLHFSFHPGKPGREAPPYFLSQQKLHTSTVCALTGMLKSC